MARPVSVAIAALREHYHQHYEGRLVEAVERIVAVDPAYADVNKIAANFS